MLTQNALPDANVPDADVARFADDFLRLSNAAPDDRIGIAVSGGPDSVALLLLAAAAFPGRVEAATVDHRLRAASADEAKFVADLCIQHRIVHQTLVLDALAAGNVSANARKARYRALNDWADARGLAWLLTAHHADDQLETVIMRLNRGAGVTGLSGVRARQGHIVRPLLSWRRAELVALVAGSGIIAVDDPSNRDDRYDRARLRKALAQAGWIDARAVAESAAAMADADMAIEWTVHALEQKYVAVVDATVSFSGGADEIPVEYIRRLVLRCLRRIDPDARPRGAALSRLVETLRNGGTATIGNVIARGGVLWTFGPAPPRRKTAVSPTN